MKEVGRSRQQSVVESRNGLIGRLLNQRMLHQEVLLGEDSTEWIHFLPKVIQVINEYYTQPAKDVDVHEPIRGTGDTLKILPVGTKVRTQLDKPKGFIRGDRLHGHFREGDIHWDPPIKTISQVYLRPGQPPMYQIKEANKPPNTNVAYTKHQLQVVRENETGANPALIKKYVVESLEKRFKKNNRIYFTVKWKGYTETTDEPRSTLIQDVPTLVLAYERLHPTDT